MDFNININRPARKDRLILAALTELLRRVDKMAADLTGLTNQVATNTTVIESALTLIQGFAAQLAEAGTDPAKLQALQDSLASEDQKLAEAVAQNTPGAPAPEPLVA